MSLEMLFPTLSVPPPLFGEPMSFRVWDDPPTARTRPRRKSLRSRLIGEVATQDGGRGTLGHTAIVVQAGMSASRLPGKSLLALGEASVLGHTLLRLKATGLPVILATSDAREDDPIEREAGRYGVQVFRGRERDVMGRLLALARAFHLQEIVRASADGPAVDTAGPARVIELRRRGHADYAVECGLPIGTDVEVVSVEALTKAQRWITDPFDFTHVTAFIRRDHRFTSMRAVAPAQLRRPGLRLVVETPADLAFMRRVFHRLGPGAATRPLASIIEAAESLAADAPWRMAQRL